MIDEPRLNAFEQKALRALLRYQGTNNEAADLAASLLAVLTALRNFTRWADSYSPVELRSVPIE
jgi:hypothetical protein